MVTIQKTYEKINPPEIIWDVDFCFDKKKNEKKNKKKFILKKDGNSSLSFSEERLKSISLQVHV